MLWALEPEVVQSVNTRHENSVFLPGLPLDPAIRLGGPYVWSATSRGAGTRFYFDATYGTSFSPGITPKLVRRVVCVRDAA